MNIECRSCWQVRVIGLAKALAWFILALGAPSRLASAAEAPDSRLLADAHDIYRTIIAMPTSEGLGQVPKMAEYLAERFRAAGFPEDDIHIIPLGETASLVVRYRGTGRGGRPILLNAHMDVVTANRADWKRDPFTLVEEGGYYFGRGTWDDKLDVATITTTFLRLRQEGFVPQRDLIIAFTGDEETRMQTAPDLLRNHRELIDAEFCLSGDMGQGALDEVTGRPLYYQVSGAEKLFVAYAITVTNAGGHSAKPRADNAIYELADALKKIQAYRFPVMWNDWTREGFRQQGPRTGGVVGAAMSQFALDPKDAAAIRVLAAEPEQVGQIGTTCVATLISGGHANNALAQSASASINCRVFPGTSAKDVQDQLQVLVGSGVVVTMTESSLESSPSPLREDVMAAVAAAVHATYPGFAAGAAHGSGGL